MNGIDVADLQVRERRATGTLCVWLPQKSNRNAVEPGLGVDGSASDFLEET